MYDQGALKEAVGDKLHHGLLAPLAKWHEGKRAGEFTHYGDQCLWLLEHLARSRGGALDEAAWAADWREKMTRYTGYVDGASKAALAGPPSASHDFSAVSRVGVLLAACKTEPELVAAAKSAVRVTHDNPHVIAAAELVARTAFRLAAAPEVSTPQPIVAVMSEVCAALGDPWLSAAVAKGIAAAKEPVSEAAGVTALGAACSVDGGLPSTVFLLARHEAGGRGAAGVEDILVANCMAGGDSSARGMVLSTLLGLAHSGEGLVNPPKWYGGVAARERIEAALALLPCGAVTEATGDLC